MAGRLPFGEGGVRRSVADEEDGDGGQADVDDQVLIVARLGADLDEIEREYFGRICSILLT